MGNLLVWLNWIRVFRARAFSILVFIVATSGFFARQAEAQTSVLYWCDSSDTSRLDLAVTKVGNKYYLNDISGFSTNHSKVNNYYLDWDLLGTPNQPATVTNIEVEPGQMHLVNLDRINNGRTINEYWDSTAGRERVVAWVWVGGSPQPQTNISSQISEIRESGSWFYFEKGKRLPAFSQRFPAFTLPTNKFFYVQKYGARDTDAGYQSHGVTKTAITLSVNFFRDDLGDDTNNANAALHISATEAGFLDCTNWSYFTDKAGIGLQYNYTFMDQEWWHNDYQTGTLARMCWFFDECKRRSPSCHVTDWWAGKPYDLGIFKPQVGNRPVVDPMWVAADYDPAVAITKADATFTTSVNANGVTTSLAQAQNAVSVNAYPSYIYSHDYIANRPDIGNYDFEMFDLIHKSRVNKRLSVNTGKPHIWFCSALQFSGSSEPLVPYSTRTTSPPGKFTFAEDLMVAPNACEAWGFFGLFEGDGAYLWDSAGLSQEDPNGIFKVAQYCINFNDNRGVWTPDVPGTPIGTTGAATNGYPSYHLYQPDYMALGAWKYSAIADIITNGTKVDFRYSTNNGTSWYTPPTNGSTMCEVASNLGVIVVGAVSTSMNQIAIAAFNPFQSITSTVHVIAQYAGNNYGFDLQGKRVRVFRGGLTAPILIPPVITHTPVAVMESPPPFTITAGATDDIQVASGVLWWNRNGGAWTSTTMSNAVGVLTGTIAVTNAVNLDQFQYRIEVSDDQGLIVTNGTHNFIYAPTPSTSYVHSGSVWKYLATNTAPSATWKNAGFDDSLWPTGKTPIGYGSDTDLATVVSYGPSSTNKYPTTYFRTTFTASNVVTLLSLDLLTRVDDGLVVYLNGSELQRFNMPGGTIGYTNLATAGATNPPRPWETFPVNPTNILPGQNTLAVEVHQQTVSSSDIYFDLQLQPESIFNGPVPVTPVLLRSVQTTAPPWTVSASTTNGNQVSSMQLVWNRNGGAWSNVTMTGTGGVYTASLSPGAIEDGDQFGYYIQTYSILGVGTTNGAYGFMYMIPKGADLLPPESSWKYLATNSASAPSASWNTAGFNDTAWPSGTAPLGYGGESDAFTVISYGPVDTNKFATTYFRKTFTATNPGSITALKAYMRVDDGLVVYINGTEAGRYNMSAGTVSYSTLASTFGANPPRPWANIDINPALLVTGLNTVATEVHQATLGSSDLFFDMFLQPDTAMTVTHTPLSAIQTSPAPWVVSARVSSYVPITTVNMIVSVNSGTPTAVPMNFSGGNYVANISPPGVGNHDQMQYRIEATDSSGTAVTNGSYNFMYSVESAPALIPSASTWSYLAQAAAPSTNWNVAAFDESAWPQGAAPIGFGSSEKLATIVDYGPDATNKYPAYYFRTPVMLGKAAAVKSLQAWTRVDDGLVVYLNGQEFGRVNMASGTVSHATLASVTASNPPRPWIQIPVDKSLLVDGSNSLSVEVHQITLGSSDISFDFYLAPTPQPAITHTILPSLTTSPSPWQVTADVESYYSLSSVKLWWTKVGGSWTNISMTGSGTYTAAIAPSPLADHDQFQYRIEAQDSTGQMITNGPFGFMYEAPPELTFVSPGSGWKYWATNAGPTGTWYSTAYNDSAWSVGAASFGFGSSSIETYTTTLPYGTNTANKYPAYYFRRTFVETGTATLVSLKGYFQVDDGLVIYLNGQEACRTNMSAGVISYTNYALTGAANPPRPWQGMALNPALVVTGQNTIAIEVHQSTPGSSDLYLDLLLYGAATNSLDSDGDGMPDAWEQTYFGGSTNGAPNADPDGDRVSNLGEYIAGTDPNSSASKPTFRINGMTNAPYQLGIQTASNRLYVVDCSTSMVPPAWSVLTNITGDGSYVTLTGTNTAWPRWYYRYRARLP